MEETDLHLKGMNKVRAECVNKILYVNKIMLESFFEWLFNPFVESCS